ncbi:MAG: hypothetical protein E7048_09565 [Lentisphaerae bacterium]|nr:hypothetical protein [Lentisphaerota bacterium]
MEHCKGQDPKKRCCKCVTGDFQIEKESAASDCTSQYGAADKEPFFEFVRDLCVKKGKVAQQSR